MHQRLQSQLILRLQLFCNQVLWGICLSTSQSPHSCPSSYIPVVPSGVFEGLNTTNKSPSFVLHFACGSTYRRWWMHILYNWTCERSVNACVNQTVSICCTFCRAVSDSIRLIALNLYKASHSALFLPQGVLGESYDATLFKLRVPVEADKFNGVC